MTFEKLQHMQPMEQNMTFGSGGVYVKMRLLLSQRKDAQIWEHYKGLNSPSSRSLNGN